MTYLSSQLQFSKKQQKQCVFTLLFFLTTFFAHSAHLPLAEFDNLLVVELHDCQLCQQNIAAPPATVNLYPVTYATFCNEKQFVVGLLQVTKTYLSPPLRAPPTTV